MEAMPKTFIKDPVFNRLGKRARYAALTDKDKKAYKESLKSYRDGYAIAETERAIGRAEGRAEGEAEGEVKGIFKTAKKMKELGIATELIMAATNLAIEEIERL